MDNVHDLFGRSGARPTEVVIGEADTAEGFVRRVTEAALRQRAPSHVESALDLLALDRAGIFTDCHPAGRTFDELATGRRVVVTADHGFDAAEGWPPPLRPVPGRRVAFVRLAGLDASGENLVDGLRAGELPRGEFVKRFTPTPATLAYQRGVQRGRRVAPLSYSRSPVPSYP